MTDHAPTVSGRHLRAMFDEMGIPWNRIRETLITPGDKIEVTYILTDEDGTKWKAGDDIASATVRARILWEDGA